MPVEWRAFLIYLAAVNFISVIVTIYDKKRARAGKWRVPEATLLTLAALGGSPMMYLTMRVVRHKTRKKKFMLGIPAIFFFQAAAVAAICLVRR
jgi:uncharacterized membrane protein YsdA (DUF1294 family)